MKKHYRLLLSFMFLGSVIVPTSSLAENRKKPPRKIRTTQAAATHGTQQSQNQNATPTATPSPSTATAPQGTQRQQSQHVTIQATPPSPTIPAERSSSAASTTNRGTQPRKGRYTLRESQAVLSGKRKSIHEISPRRPGGRGPQQHNAMPAATPPPREAEKTRTSQQSSAQNTSTDTNRTNPFIRPASLSKDTTNSQSVANDSLNQAEQPTIPQSQEQPTPPASEPVSGNTTAGGDEVFEFLDNFELPVPPNMSPPSMDWDGLSDFSDSSKEEPLTIQSSTESQKQDSPTSNNASTDGASVNNNQKQVPSNPSSMSVKQGIALLQGLNIALDGSNRPSPENREMAADMTHTVLADLDAIYRYEGDGSLGTMSKFASKFGQRLFAWLQEHPFANFRKESDKETMRDFAQKLSTRFQDDADFRRECEMLEENFIQEQEDYQTNCARACMQVVSLFLHPETV